jgi:SAM-dependent methyltransferase
MFLYTRILEAFPRLKQRVFLALYQYLARYDHVSWTFMNYGHAPEMGRPLRLLTEDEADRYCIQLYEKVTSGVSLHGKAILEVGSGRGGGLSYLHRYRRPASSRGVDLSPLAVNFCNERHRRTGDDLWFRTGDALALPYNEATFDVVVNVESSHCYPSRLAFFHEACREDLTPGVLRALKLDDARKRTMINQLCPWILRRPVSAFAAVVGSRTYTSFVLGARQYTRWLAVKR